MKKILSLILILALAVPALALADLPDISGLSFEELVQLRDQINLAMWNSQEWQEVVVPVGVWKIGEDIPAGKWTISAASNNAYVDTYIVYCDVLEPSGLEGSARGSVFYYKTLENKNNNEGWYPKSIDIDCKEGLYIVISQGPALFTPYVGKPDLGFK